MKHLALAVLLLAGCTSSPTGPPEPDVTLICRWVEQGDGSVKLVCPVRRGKA